MIEVKTRKHGVDFYKVWFAKEPLKKSGVITYNQSALQGKNSDNFITLISDITKTPDEIKGAFTKNCRYKVNRAEREDVNIRFLDDAEITDEEIEFFLAFFKTFWESKGSAFDREEEVRRDLKAYREAGALTFAVAKVKGQDAVYHTYVYDDERARLLHSASLYRLIGDEESDSRNIIGMANRYLHYMDMLHFKDKGLKIYDWGGAGRGEDVINITEFKESFGGITETSYDYEEVKGFMAKLFKFIVNALDDVMIKNL